MMHQNQQSRESQFDNDNDGIGMICEYNNAGRKPLLSQNTMSIKKMKSFDLQQSESVKNYHNH